MRLAETFWFNLILLCVLLGPEGLKRLSFRFSFVTLNVLSLTYFVLMKVFTLGVYPKIKTNKQEYMDIKKQYIHLLLTKLYKDKDRDL